MPRNSVTLQLEPGFLAQLPVKGVERMLVLVDEPAGEVPEPRGRIVCTPAEQHAAVTLDDSLRAGDRVRVERSAALLAHSLAGLVPERPRAQRAEAPAIEDPHRATVSR